jgi:Ca2+-binding EF-hand superfamily protein
MMGERVR